MAFSFSSVPASDANSAQNTALPVGGSVLAPADAERTIRVARFDEQAEGQWRELVRDIAALANSGGGQMIVDAALDRASVLSRLRHYTDSDFTDVRVALTSQPDAPGTVIEIGPAVFPLGIGRADSDGGAQANAAQQTVAPGFYFRHGRRSELGTSADMRAFVARLLRRVRRRWLRGMRRLLARAFTLDEAAAPRRSGNERIRLERTVLQPVRIVSDPNAPALQPQDVDRLYPWRQKDLLAELNRRLGGRLLNRYDIQAVRRHHRLDERADFVFNLPGAGRRYSPAVADWVMEQYDRDTEFFQKARAADQQSLQLRRKKPR